MNTNKLKLKPKQLSKACKPAIFHFQSTAELKPLQGKNLKGKRRSS
ncbi:MAG: hypothetical protein U9N81_01680 [Bacillota bacterium]|nr:hypothetical protein [Bacillota bacterium]